VSARLFRAAAATQDFRDARWTSEPMTAAGGDWVGRVDRPAEGYAAVFGEITYEQDGTPFTVSTQIRILGARD
jgi:hypothetical protein